MTLDASPVTFGQFVFGDGGQEPGGGPALLVGLFGEPGPDQLDGRQAQFVEKQTEPPRVCRRPIGLSYAAMAGCSSMA